RQLAFDLYEGRQELKVLVRRGTPRHGLRHRSGQRRVRGSLLAGSEEHLPAWRTATDPSTTDTTEPPRPADTAKTLPFTDAIESRVRTRRCPRRCLAAWTMTSPRWR